MLTDREMMQINGGAVSWSIVGIVGAALALIAGVVDGLFRPLACNK